jgi:hypothetical protein
MDTKIIVFSREEFEEIDSPKPSLEKRVSWFFF